MDLFYKLIVEFIGDHEENKEYFCKVEDAEDERIHLQTQLGKMEIGIHSLQREAIKKMTLLICWRIISKIAATGFIGCATS